MRFLVILAVLSLAAAKPAPGVVSPWGEPAYSSLGVYQQPAVAVAQPLVHAAPVAIAKPVAAATSYSSFQQVVHPVHVAQPVVQAVAHAPVIQAVAHAPVVQAAQVIQAAPVIQAVAHAPVVQSAPVVQQVYHSSPVVQTYAQPVVSGYGHGW